MQNSLRYNPPSGNMDDFRAEHHSLLNKEGFRKGILLTVRSFRFQLLGTPIEARNIGIFMEKLAREDDFRGLCTYIQGILDRDEYFPSELRTHKLPKIEIPSPLENLKVTLEMIRDDLLNYLLGKETKYDVKHNELSISIRLTINDLIFPDESFIFGKALA